MWVFTCKEDASLISYHHQECRNPGGSPSVIFFSHRICKNGSCVNKTWMSTARLKSSHLFWAVKISMDELFPHMFHIPLIERSVQTSVLLCAANTHRRTKPTWMEQKTHSGVNFTERETTMENPTRSRTRGDRSRAQALGTMASKTFPRKIDPCDSARNVYK